MVADDEAEFELVDEELKTNEKEKKDLEAKIETLQNELRSALDYKVVHNEGHWKNEETEEVS